MGTSLLEPWAEAIQGSLSLKYELTINDATPSNNEIKNMHYLKYKQLRMTWWLLVRQALSRTVIEKPLCRCFLEINRYCAGAGLDWDNAYGGLKPLLDCLVTPSARNPNGLALIRDDNLQSMPCPPLVRQFKAPNKQRKTVLKIYEIIDNV